MVKTNNNSVKYFIRLAIACALILFFSRPFLNPLGVVIQKAPEIYRAATGAAIATGAFIYGMRQNERSGNYLPKIREERFTSTDDSLDGSNTVTTTRRK